MLREWDGFDHYITTSGITFGDPRLYGKWTSSGTLQGAFPAGRFGYGKMFIGHSTFGNVTLKRNLSLEPTEDGTTSLVHVAFQWAIYNNGIAAGSIFNLYDTAGTKVGYLKVNSDRTLSYVQGSTVVCTTTNQLLLGDWTFVGLRVLLDTGASGEAEIAMFGVSDVTVTGVQTSAGLASMQSYELAQLGTGTLGNHWVDDFGFFDIDAATPALTGEWRTLTDAATGDGTTQQFTPLSGTNVSNVGENPNDGDTSYVHAQTSGYVDEYTFDALIFSPVAIYAVACREYARKDNASALQLEARIRSGATPSLGPATDLGSANYGLVSHRLTEDPDTAAAWTEAGVNAAQLGPAVV
jgi:hypothetical protein